MEQLLTTYSFFAALTESSSDLYTAVYIPMCKRALSLYAQSHSEGYDIDIKNTILSEYGIDVPLVVIKQLIKKVVSDFSRKEKNDFAFNIYEKGNDFSFSYQHYSFSKIEDTYISEKRHANKLQSKFEEFLKNHEKDSVQTSSFISFINLNKNRVSAFLAGKENSFTDLENNSFLPHVHFLQHLAKNEHELYKTVEKIFIGSIIASYLETEVDIAAKPATGIVYYLDTKVVLELFDLQRPEDTTPIKELIKLIKDTGGKVRVLNITYDEIISNLDNAITNYNNEAPTSTINEAVLRKKKSKSWLIHLKGSLEKELKNSDIDIEIVPQGDIEKFSQSKDAEDLKKIWFKQHTASHDVISYMYVRKRRQNDTNKIMVQKARFWFITENRKLQEFNKKNKINGNVCEITTPDNLTSLLFLQNPQKLSKRVSSIGLNELIAQTLSDEYPSKDLINEFHNAISCTTEISENDYNLLLETISRESTIKIRKLLEINRSSPEKFNGQIHHIIAQEKERNKKNEEERIKLTKKINSMSKDLEDLTKENKRTRKYLIALLICIVLSVLYSSIPSIQNTITNIISKIAALGGLWSFIALIWNLTRSNK